MKFNIVLASIVTWGFLFGNVWDSFAQNNMRYGVTGGLNLSRVKTSINLTDPLWTYRVGLALEMDFSDNLSLAGELVYSRQGGSVDNVFSGKYITKFDYLAAPIIARYRPGGKNFFIQAGGRIGFLVHNNEIYTHNDSEGSLDHLRSLDAGILGGIGYRLGNHFVVDARYYHGLTTMYKKHWVLDPITLEPIFYASPKSFNRVWSLNLTFYLW